MTVEISQHELRERLIAELPDLIAQFEAQHGQVETLPLIKGRELSLNVRRQYSCPERRAVLGQPVAAPKPKGRHGGYRGVRGPRPQNLAKIRELLPLNLTVTEMVKRSGLSRPTVITTLKLVRADIEAQEAKARSEALAAIRTKAVFRREWRMRRYRVSGHDRWAKLEKGKA